MGMHVLRPKTAEQRALAAKLPRGRIFASGKGLVPFVRAGLYEALARAANRPLRARQGRLRALQTTGVARAATTAGRPRRKTRLTSASVASCSPVKARAKAG